MVSVKNHYQVEWSQDRCPRPQDCGKCLEVCPEAVFALYAPNRKEGEIPDEYIISPAMQYFCSGCMACIDICPKDALQIIAKASPPSLP